MKKVLTVLLALFVAVAFSGVTVAADNAAKAAPAKKADTKGEVKGEKKAPAAADNAAKAPAKPAEKK
jgi:uncharacterized protein YxeA